MLSIKSHKDTKIELEIAKSRLAIIEADCMLLKEQIKNLSSNLLKIEANLKELSGIEHKLYYQIIVKGSNVTRAIDKVSYDVDKDVSTLWKVYYPKIKDKIKSTN